MGGQEMVLMKRNFSGEKGYMEQQGQTIMMTDEEINEAKLVEGIIDELYFTDDQIELVSINSIDNDDVYKIKLTKNEKISFEITSISSGDFIYFADDIMCHTNYSAK